MACVGSSVAVSADHHRRPAVHPAGGRATRWPAVLLFGHGHARPAAAAPAARPGVAVAGRGGRHRAGAVQPGAGPRGRARRTGGDRGGGGVRSRCVLAVAGPLLAGVRPAPLVVVAARSWSARVRCWCRAAAAPTRPGWPGPLLVLAQRGRVHAARGAGAGPAGAVGGVAAHGLDRGARCWPCSGVSVEGPARGGPAGRRRPARRRATWPSWSPRWPSCSGTARCAGSAPAGPGCFTGVAPVTAAVGGVLLGGPWPAPTVWLGTAVVVAGLVIAFGTRSRARPAPAPGPAARPTPGPAPRLSCANGTFEQ